MASQAPAIGTDIRRLMRRCRRVALGTLGESGEPYVSLAMVALEQDGTPLLHLSDLADHTRHLKRDDRDSELASADANRPADEIVDDPTPDRADTPLRALCRFGSADAFCRAVGPQHRRFTVSCFEVDPNE